MKREQPVPAKAHDGPYVIMIGDAVLRYEPKLKIPTKFVIRSVDGVLPYLVELILDPDTSDFAFQNGPTVEMEICGAKVRTHISSRNYRSHTLFLFAAPFLRDLAEAMAGYVGSRYDDEP